MTTCLLHAAGLSPVGLIITIAFDTFSASQYSLPCPLTFSRCLHVIPFFPTRIQSSVLRARMMAVVSDYSCDFPRFNLFKSNRSVSDQMFTSHIESAEQFKSRFKSQSLLGLAYHCHACIL